MSLDGIAAAIYQRKDGQHVVSSSTLSSESDEQIFIETNSLTDIDPGSEHTNGRKALLTILEEISSRRAQIVDIGEQSMLVPLTVVHGVAEQHEKDAYVRMIQDAFPEYFSGSRAPKNVRTVNGLLQHLIRGHHAAHAPALKADEPTSQLSLQDFTLFFPDDRSSSELRVTAEDQQAGAFIAGLLMQARTGDRNAKASLKELVRLDAERCAADLQRRGILDSTRFIQFGLHSDEFKKAPRYTYLEWDTLKDYFVSIVISKLSEPHHIAMKTPNDASSPAFADITTTFLADVWRVIQYHRTGRVGQFKNTRAQKKKNS